MSPSQFCLIASLIALSTAQGQVVQTQTAPAVLEAEFQRIHPRITAFENSLRTALKLALLQSIKATKPGEVIFGNPTVDGLRPPVPQGGLLFVVRMPPLQWPWSLGPPPELDTPERLRNAVIDTMVESGVNLPLESDEWLTIVGLSDSDSGARVPYKLYLSIRGSDLERIKNRTLSVQEARERIRVVREF